MTDEEIRVYFGVPQQYRANARWIWIGPPSAWRKFLRWVGSQP